MHQLPRFGGAFLRLGFGNPPNPRRAPILAVAQWQRVLRELVQSHLSPIIGGTVMAAQWRMCAKSLISNSPFLAAEAIEFY
jgi:hypothetical protein